LAHFLKRIDAAQLEVGARHRHDRDRHILQVLLTASGRDDDLFETFLCRRGLVDQSTRARHCCHDGSVQFGDFHANPQKN
jgi:hypothetical protein